jgi:hypothetical protein
MPTANELRDQVWSAMNALPKPVTKDLALSTALAVFSAGGKESTQFQGWWEKYSDYVLERLNGR